MQVASCVKLGVCGGEDRNFGQLLLKKGLEMVGKRSKCLVSALEKVSQSLRLLWPKPEACEDDADGRLMMYLEAVDKA